ncbi:zinc ribbon domain-containing protein [Deinococcus radiophilus]|nr:zinc ribbon domain-containing protein [Deinococcus radiophilus]UFA51482.1 zinc ribbon domain-containing protein [Deinococcus radiophilus]
MTILARLAAKTSNSFAAMMQSAVEQLTRQQESKPLPAPVYLPIGMYITRCPDMNGHMLTLSFTQPDIFYPKDQVLGIDWGLTYLLSVAPTDDINEVQYFTLPPAALDWIKRTPVSDGAEWQIIRAFTAKRLEPALAYIVQHGAVVRSENIKTKHMDQGISAKLQKLGLIDFQRAILPQAIYTSGGRSERIAPVGTSVTCHKCAQVGERSGTTLTCPQHGDVNADGNAAIWMLRGGVASGC